MDKPKTIAEHRLVRDAESYIGRTWMSADGEFARSNKVVGVEVNRHPGGFFVELVVQMGDKPRRTYTVLVEQAERMIRDDERDYEEYRRALEEYRQEYLRTMPEHTVRVR